MTAATVGLAALGVVPAPPGASAVTGAVTAVGFRFVPASVTVLEGDTLEFVNLDSAPHDVVSVEVPPLFQSDLVAGPATTTVRGVEALEPGDYPFFCTVHNNMEGVLSVVENPLPPLPVDPFEPPAVSVATGTVPTPTSLTVRGTDLYVASWGSGTVSRLPILPEGLLGPPTTYAGGFVNPLGIAFGPDGTLFVSDSHPSSRSGRTRDGRVWAVPPGGGPPQVVIDQLPNGRHNTNGMAVDGDRLYITNGNSTDDGVSGGSPEEALSGTLLSIPLEGRDLTPASAEVVVEARGMRNNFDVAFRPGAASPEAWMTMNGLDAQEPYGEDLLLKAEIEPLAPVPATSAPPALTAASGPSTKGSGKGGGGKGGGKPTTTTTSSSTTSSTTTTTLPPPPERVVEDFGFPGCVHGEGSLAGVQNANPAVTDKCDGTETPPEALLGLHVSANGLAFGPGGYWKRDLFIAEYGNNPGETNSGHKVVRVPIGADGTVIGPPQDLLTLPSPLDVAFGPNGLYVADFTSGQILLLRPPA
ncbi:MAG TPA: cupredoxin domain-containing protein [Acidimicrobiales bacterium]|nr:cupredoxin domain-containing protein [Acidimicrobiales bacterium]